MNREELIINARECVRSMCRKYGNDEDLITVGTIASIQCIDANKALWNDPLIKHKYICWAKNAIINEMIKKKYEPVVIDEMEDTSQDIGDVELGLYLKQVLSVKDQQVMNMLLLGKTDDEIMSEMGISPRTLRYHKTKIRRGIESYE